MINNQNKFIGEYSEMDKKLSTKYMIKQNMNNTANIVDDKSIVDKSIVDEKHKLYCDLRTITFIGTDYSVELPIVLLSGVEYWYNFAQFNKNKLYYKTNLSRKILLLYINTITPDEIIVRCICDNDSDCKDCFPDKCIKLQIQDLYILQIISLFEFAHETQDETCMRYCLEYFYFDKADVLIPNSRFTVVNCGYIIQKTQKPSYFTYDIHQQITSIELPDIKEKINIKVDLLDTDGELVLIDMNIIHKLMKLCDTYNITYEPLLQTIGFYLSLDGDTDITTKCLISYLK